MKATRSIRKQLLRSLFGSLVLLYALGSLVIYFIVQQAIDRKFDQLLRQTLLNFAEETRISHDRESGGESRSPPRISVHDLFDTEYCQIRDSNGRTIKISYALNGKDLPFHEVANDTVLISPVTLPNGRPGKVGIVTFQPKAHWRRGHNYDTPQLVNLAVAMPTGEERITLNILAITLLITGAFMGGAIFFIVRDQVDKSYRPLDQLVKLTGSIQPEELSVRLPCTELPSELSPLVGQFNILLDRLETAFDRERSFSASLGHEIRTPLTELAALLGNATLDARQATPSENPETVYTEANQICQHMNRLIEVISSVHQAESGRELVNIDTTEPGLLLSRVIEGNSRALNESGLTIERFDTRDPGLLSLATDPTMVRAILQNLISNAINYSKPGSVIKCYLEPSQPGSQRIKITNTVADLSPKDLDRISQPFWQKDKSRTEQSSFGLGLSLVDGYAKLLDSKLDFNLTKDEFTVTLELSDLE